MKRRELISRFFFLLNMICACASNKVKPIAYCLSCLHKHLSIAMSLTAFDRGNRDIVQLKIASQIYLAMLHAGNLNELKNRCIQTISKIAKGDESYVDLLEHLLDEAWRCEDMDPIETTDIIAVTENASFDGILLYSNAIELLYFEPGHEDDNRSYAVGQLAIAECKLRDFSKKIREIRHSIAEGTCTLEKMHFLRKSMWEWFCQNSRQNPNK